MTVTTKLLRPCIRHLIPGLILFAFATLSWAQAYDPKIAYTSFQGKADSIIVANADGSNTVTVYKTNKVRLDAIDMAPVDPAAPTLRRIAFSEAGVLKVLTYEVLSGGIRVLGPPTLLDSTGAPFEGTTELDFSPDGSRILYLRRVFNEFHQSPTPGEIRLVPSTGGPPKVLLTVSHAPEGIIRQPRWLSASEFAFQRALGLPYSSDIQLASLDADGNLSAPTLTLLTTAHSYFADKPAVVPWISAFDDFDVARTRSALLLTVSQTSTNYRDFVEYDFIENTFVTHFSDHGWRGHFSNGDAHIVYLHQKPGIYHASDYVQRYDIGSSNTVKFSNKGSFGYADTQP